MLIQRRFEENDLSSLFRLLRSIFNGYPSIEHWTWKYLENPHGSPTIWVAEDKGRIVGCYILNPVKLRIGQTLVLGAQPVDAAVDNDYRGGGIFKKLADGARAQAKKDGVSIIFAFPNEISYKGQVRIGYRPMFIIPKMLRVFRMGSLLEGRVWWLSGSFFNKTLGMIDSFQRISAKRVSNELNYGFKVKVISEFDSRFESFWKEICSKNNDVLVERDLEYLNWRYMKHPEKHYTSYVCEKNGKIVGFVVVNVEKDIVFEKGGTNRLSRGNIIDLLTLPNMTNVAFQLVSAACSHFENERVDVAECWMFGWHPFHAVLGKFGFSDFYELLRRTVSSTKYGSRLIYYVNSKANIQEALMSTNNSGKSCRWFIAQGDADFT
jgi:N-acetylglutamate synthase-like GNAT family acetyltransferase